MRLLPTILCLSAYYGPIIKSVPWGSFLHFLACLWEKREGPWLCDNYSSDRDAFLFVFVLPIVDFFPDVTSLTKEQQ